MIVRDLGRMSYRPCTELQREILERVASCDEDDTLLLVEHEPVITLGAAFHAENLLLSEPELRNRGIEVEHTDRGGDVTYHGPGQLVAYPIFNLRRHGSDLHKWLRGLEDVVIRCLAEFGLAGSGLPLPLQAAPHRGAAARAPCQGAGGESDPQSSIPNRHWTGVWVADRKICAIGVKVRRWTSMHGLALNCNTDLTPFSYITPCGITEFGVTSISRELGRDVPVGEVKNKLVQAFGRFSQRQGDEQDHLRLSARAR